MTTDFRALITRMANELDGYRQMLLDNRTVTHQLSNEARAALVDESTSATEQPTDEDLLNLHEWMADEWAANHDFELPPSQYARAVLARWDCSQPAPNKPTVMEIIELAEEIEEAGLGQVDLVRTALARWGTPNLAETRSSLEDGKVTELVAWLQEEADDYDCIGCADSAVKCNRAAELLQRQALVPASVSDALIKAECALSDIAEGELMTDEGDPLQWAERRCADTLAIIRPTMRQHNIRTSEWPPVPAHALLIPQQQETNND